MLTSGSASGAALVAGSGAGIRSPGVGSRRSTSARPLTRLQRFGSKEHRSLGNNSSGTASVAVGGTSSADQFDLNFGDVVALSGDYFLTAKEDYPPSVPYKNDDLFTLGAKPGSKGKLAGTRDEIICALHEVDKNDPRFAKGGPWEGYDFSEDNKATEDVRKAVKERYSKLAAANNPHFVAPRGRDSKGNPVPAAEGAAGSTYRTIHERALKIAYEAGGIKGAIEPAMATEAAAQHYLTDAFSAGHVRTEIINIREYWLEKYPLFWYNLRHKIALDTAIALNDIDTNLATIGGTVQDMYMQISAEVEKMAGSLPAVTLGDLLAKVFHDWDNEQGVEVQTGGKVYGDGNLDKKADDNKTRDLAEAAVKAGIVEVEEAFALGQSGAKLDDAALYASILSKSTTPTADSASAGAAEYAGERLIPKPAAGQPRLNWKAGTIEQLMALPVVSSGGSVPTVGDRIVAALGPGQEIRKEIEGLAENFDESQPVYVRGRRIGTVHPKAAYQQGFLGPLVSDPKKGVLSIVHWAPNYGLLDTDQDDISRATAQELLKSGQLGGMTTPARAKYIKELIGGNVSGGEEDLVVELFKTAPAGERPKIYQLTEGHKWTGNWIEGVFVSDDDIWNALSSGRLKTLRDLINGK